MITTKIVFGSGTKLHVDARKIESLQSGQSCLKLKLNFKMLHTEKKKDSDLIKKNLNFKLDSKVKRC